MQKELLGIMEAYPQLILQQFASAPYPHPSRQGQISIGGKTYTSDVNYSDNTVGIYIPSGYKQMKTVDYVVHFHGHYNYVARVFNQFSLGPQLEASERNAILIIPQGPRDAGDSGCGRLELERGAFETLINDVGSFLLSKKLISTSQIGNIVLSAHSGGYKVTSAILKIGGLRDNITDVLLFDATYGNLDGFSEWMKDNTHGRIISIFTEHLAAMNVQLMAMIQSAKTPFAVMVEDNYNADSLNKRGKAHFLYTTKLQHNDVIDKENHFATWVSSARLLKK